VRDSHIPVPGVRHFFDNLLIHLTQLFRCHSWTGTLIDPELQSTGNGSSLP